MSIENGSNFREIKGTVASMRLDALVGLGFGISRSKAAYKIKAGQVQVDGETVLNTAARVDENGQIEIPGQGTLVVEEIGGISRKGRQNLTLKKYYE